MHQRDKMAELIRKHKANLHDLIHVFVAIWHCVDDSLLAWHLHRWVSYSISLMGAKVAKDGWSRWAELKGALGFVTSAYHFLPVLKTVTKTCSTDTVYAASVFLLSDHLNFFRCGANAAPPTQHAALLYGHLCFCVHGLTSSLAPACLHHGDVCHPDFCTFSGLCYRKTKGLSSPWLGGVTLLSSFRPWRPATHQCPGSRALSLLLVSVSCLCPFYLNRFQLFKEDIHGPWGKAELKDLSRFLS
ncbi:phosphatidylinositol N-acetylglucosaminyltransferase subunit C-like [Erethizon dorsatum]